MGKLTVTIKRARGLLPCDRTGSSDPLCFISCAGGDEFRTKTCPQTLTPVWEETFSFNCMRARMPKLRIVVMDEDDDDSTDFLGMCEVALISLHVDQEYCDWHSLTDASGVAVADNKHGALELSYCYVPEAHEEKSTVAGAEKKDEERAEDAMLFAARMAGEAVRAEHGLEHGLEDEDGSDEELARKGPEWLAGYQKFGAWKELVHGRPEPVHTPDGERVETFPVKVIKQCGQLFAPPSHDASDC